MTAPHQYPITSGNGPERSPALEEQPQSFLPPTLARREAELRQFIRAHPVPVVLGALLAGFALARWFRED